MPVPSGRALSLSNNPFGEVWRTRRSATSIVAAAAGRARRSFRLTPSGRFVTSGGKCPGCSIIRASLTVALMVSLPRFGSLWAFGPSAHRAHASLRATGLTLPFGALMVSLPSQISAFCALAARSPCICSRLRVALRYAQQPTGLTLPSGAPSGRFGPSAQVPTGYTLPFAPLGWRFPPVPGGRGVCAPGRKHFLSFWRKRPPQADFFDKLKGRPARPFFFSVKAARRFPNGAAACFAVYQPRWSTRLRQAAPQSLFPRASAQPSTSGTHATNG